MATPAMSFVLSLASVIDQSPARGAGAVAGTPQTLNVSETALSNTNAQGAWRSGMLLTFTAPAATKALVAGQYTGVTNLTLTAL